MGIVEILTILICKELRNRGRASTCQKLCEHMQQNMYCSIFFNKFERNSQLKYSINSIIYTNVINIKF